MSTREHLHSVVTTLLPVVKDVAFDDAAPFDSVLAQAGRDPEWSAT